jgi:hypothetical protein
MIGKKLGRKQFLPNFFHMLIVVKEMLDIYKQGRICVEITTKYPSENPNII